MDIGVFEPLSDKIRREEGQLSFDTAEPDSTITLAWEQKKKPSRVNYFDAFPAVPMEQRHNFSITDNTLGQGGAKAKFRANMGFTSGNILDPGCGTGNFQGLLPDSMADSMVLR